MSNDVEIPNDHDWMHGSGVVADRTNIVITGVLEWAVKSSVDTVKRRNIEDATKHLANVGSDDAIQQYVERVTNYGPFFSARAPGLWRIDWSEVEAANATDDAADDGTLEVSVDDETRELLDALADDDHDELVRELLTAYYALADDEEQDATDAARRVKYEEGE